MTPSRMIYAEHSRTPQGGMEPNEVGSVLLGDPVALCDSSMGV